LLRETPTIKLFFLLMHVCCKLVSVGFYNYIPHVVGFCKQYVFKLIYTCKGTFATGQSKDGYNFYLKGYIFYRFRLKGFMFYRFLNSFRGLYYGYQSWPLPIINHKSNFFINACYFCRGIFMLFNFYRAAVFYLVKMRYKFNWTFDV